jgi:hypothetical protein
LEGVFYIKASSETQLMDIEEGKLWYDKGTTFKRSDETYYSFSSSPHR